MSIDTPPSFNSSAQHDALLLHLQGAWMDHTRPPAFDALRDAVSASHCKRVRLEADTDFRWDSQAMTRVFLLARYCDQQQIDLDSSALPAGMQKLLAVATAIKPQVIARAPTPNLAHKLTSFAHSGTVALQEQLEFVGGAAIAFGRLFTGSANTRLRDVFYFIEQCLTQALGIVALIAVLVGMILAYLGSVQLRLFGAEVYVANLVALGMVREMGALMTAVIMAGRTGAAYAAQLGAMQSNEEIDAITTLGISPMEYLVLPRMLALIAVMPALCIFADVLGLFGGALVAVGMDVNFTQFITQARESVTVNDVFTGLFKSFVFAILIATAGCQAGLHSGRSSAAV